MTASLAVCEARLGGNMFKKRIIERDTEAGDARYGDELLSANWNPVIDLLARSASVTRERASRPSQDEGEVDIDGFLNRVYTAGA
jgi:hypothetical protein